MRRHAGRGLCAACLQADPNRVASYADRLAERSPAPPPWLPGFAASLSATRHPSCAVDLLRHLGTLLNDGDVPPLLLLARCQADHPRGRQLGRALRVFFTSAGLTLPDDSSEQQAWARRARLLDAVPASLRPVVAEFAAAQITARDRALRVGTRMRSHDTIENNLAAVRDLARHLEEQITGWEHVAVGDVEAFLAAHPANRARLLSSLRAFFRHCRARRRVLVDPTRGLGAEHNAGFRGPSMPLAAQQQLLRRWADPGADPQEAVVGLLALLHAASAAELRSLALTDVDTIQRTVRLGRRPHQVPLDPMTWSAAAAAPRRAA